MTQPRFVPPTKHFESNPLRLSLISTEFGDITLALAAVVSQPEYVDPSLGLSKETTIAVFIAGVFPFVVATIEFWRRIAVGASFGTSEPVVFTIGEDDAPSKSRGKQVLGKDALVTAYVIFGTVAIVLGIVFAAIFSSPVPDSL